MSSVTPLPTPTPSAARLAGKSPVPQRKTLSANDVGLYVNKPSIKRIARRGGVKRMSSCVYDTSREVLVAWMDRILSDSAVYASHAHRKTITSMDVLYALKRHGQFLYGYKSR